MTSPIKLLTLAEAARALRISEASLYRILARGDLKRTRIGGRVFVRESEMLRFLDRGTR